MRRARGPAQFGAERSGAQFDSDIAEKLDKLEKGLREKVLRSAAYAGAKVFYSLMKAKMPVDEGVLAGSLYHWHDDKRSRPTYQQYAIGPNKVKAPHWHQVEFGHWRVNYGVYRDGVWIPSKKRLPAPKWVPASPYVRPAWAQGKEPAKRAVIERARERLKEVINDL